MRVAVPSWRPGDAVAYDELLTRSFVVGDATEQDPMWSRALGTNGFDRRAVTAMAEEPLSPRVERSDRPFDSARVLADEILPILFAGAQASDTPRLVLLNGLAGSGSARAIAQLVTERTDGIAVVSPAILRRLIPESESTGSDIAVDANAIVAEWLSACLRHARDNHLPLLVDAPFRSADATLGLAKNFASQNFEPVVAVVAVSRAESLMAQTSAALRSPGREVPTVAIEAHNRDLAQTRATLEAFAQSSTEARVVVLDRNGTAQFDSAQSAERTGAVTALDRAAGSRMSTLQATQWLSELRHITEFVKNPATRRRDMTDAVIALNDLALRDVIPRLALPTGSPVAKMLETRIAGELQPLREVAHKRPRRDVDVERGTGPAVPPPSPDRSGPSR